MVGLIKYLVLYELKTAITCTTEYKADGAKPIKKIAILVINRELREEVWKEREGYCVVIMLSIV